MENKLLYLARVKMRLIGAAYQLYTTNDDIFCDIAHQIDDLYRDINKLQRKSFPYLQHKPYDVTKY